MLNLKTTTTDSLIKFLDKKFNYTYGWKSTVFSKKDLEIIAYNLIELLNERDEVRFYGNPVIPSEVLEIYIKIVVDIYEGYAELKTAETV